VYREFTLIYNGQEQLSQWPWDDSLDITFRVQFLASFDLFESLTQLSRPCGSQPGQFKAASTGNKQVKTKAEENSTPMQKILFQSFILKISPQLYLGRPDLFYLLVYRFFHWKWNSGGRNININIIHSFAYYIFIFL
jgi:hypothetical protein